MSMRGVGSETTDLGADPGVALSQDGISLVRPQMLNADFLDVERVEVLRGPQGTILRVYSSAEAPLKSAAMAAALHKIRIAFLPCIDIPR